MVRSMFEHLLPGALLRVPHLVLTYVSKETGSARLSNVPIII